MIYYTLIESIEKLKIGQKTYYKDGSDKIKWVKVIFIDYEELVVYVE